MIQIATAQVGKVAAILPEAGFLMDNKFKVFQIHAWPSIVGLISYRIIHLPIDYGQIKALRIASNGQAEEDHLHDWKGKDEQHYAHIAPHSQHILGEQGANFALGGDLAQAGVAVLAALLVIGIVVSPRGRGAVRLLVELIPKNLENTLKQVFQERQSHEPCKLIRCCR